VTWKVVLTVRREDVVGVALQSGVVGVGIGFMAVLMLASSIIQEVFDRAVHLQGCDPY
jgi:hypothetical protein